jgi:hypothetical protein
MSGSSKIIIRRSVSDPLTLCQSIAANTDPTTLSTLLVADNSTTTVAASANCNARTTDNPLLVVRPATVYPTSPATSLPTTKLALTLPVALRKARDYRCKLDQLNPAVAYDSATKSADDFCDGSSLEKVRIAVSDRAGRILIFNQNDETADTGNTADTVSTGVVKKYSIAVEAVNTVSATNDALGMNKATIDNNTKNKAVEYSIGNPIYLLEERVYSLNSAGEFQVSVNGKAPSTLIKKIENFRVSARGYTNATDAIINPTPTTDVCADTAPFSSQPASASATVDAPQYICKFNYNALTSDPAMNWKMIAGIKIELHAKYDGTGRADETSTKPADIIQIANDKDKLKAAAEYFPRNVLSK